MPNKRQKSEKRGRYAEIWASLFLFIKGYRTVNRRFRSKRGEIDLICKHGTTVIFVEVKARKTVDDALYSIAYKQRKRIEAASEDWLKLNPGKAKSLRFDVVAIAPRAFPTHIRDAWRPTSYK
tara:strand:+ start:1507 stop:1875 length:369 start_codon:yes stop_codon:yes gene_type:complete